MQRIKVKIIDSFTKIPFTGNPAGVVLDAEKLNAQQMQQIARELNLSETVFVQPSTKNGVDFRLRWFTPSTEVALCGHATVAAFHGLAEDKRNGVRDVGEYQFHIDTASGILPIGIIKKNSDTEISMGLNLPLLQQTSQTKVELIRVLNITSAEFENNVVIGCDNNLYIGVKRFHTLFSMKPNFVTMSYFLETRNLQGLCVYTTETVDRESRIHSRFFAPTLGINEDPVTGSAHGPLAVILYEKGLLKITDGKCEFIGEQGDAMGRRGRVKVELEVEDEKPASIKIIGNAVTILQGEINLND